MASLKEIKARIGSVKSTRKITSAMKMVSAAKLHKAQDVITGMLPYSEALSNVMKDLLSGEGEMNLALSHQREVKRVAIVAFSSNSSLCGGFNANVERALLKAIKDYKKLPQESVEIYAIGKKVADRVVKNGYRLTLSCDDLADTPNYEKIAEIAQSFIDSFIKGELDKVVLIYHHFKSAGSQLLVKDVLLPVVLEKSSQENTLGEDYILEPSRQEILDTLVPKAVKLKLFTALSDSKASEHAARVIAMQAATDNADELIGDLTIEYNKSRQQAITNELLDIIGGTMK